MLRKTKQWKLALLQINVWDIDGLPCTIIQDDKLETRGNYRK